MNVTKIPLQLGSIVIGGSIRTTVVRVCNRTPTFLAQKEVAAPNKNPAYYYQDHSGPRSVVCAESKKKIENLV